MTDVRELMQRAKVADGHADSLMWNRDLTELSSEGHLDFPRLREAGVTLQCFTLVTRGLPIIGGFQLFAAYRGWPGFARAGEWARATWQIDRLADYCRRSGGHVVLTVSAKMLADNLEQGKLSALIGVEGGHALEGKVERVAQLFERGVRFMGLTNLWNNELGGSSSPLAPARGLTELGAQVLEEMVRVGMMVDIAHASPKLLVDLLAHPKARLFCSHTGVAGVTRSWRNLSDETLKAVADRGGVVGILYGTGYLGGKELSHLVRHIDHAVKVMGEDAVALGSDFDGMVPLPRGMRDVRDIRLVAEELLRSHPEGRVEKILGGNLHRYFAENLPS